MDAPDRRLPPVSRRDLAAAARPLRGARRAGPAPAHHGHRLFRQPGRSADDLLGRPGRAVRGPQRGQPGASLHAGRAVSTAPRRRWNSPCGCCRCDRIVVMGHALCGGISALLGGAPPEARDFVAGWIGIAAARPRRGAALRHRPSSGRKPPSMRRCASRCDNLMTFPWVAEAVAGRARCRCMARISASRPAGWCWCRRRVSPALTAPAEPPSSDRIPFTGILGVGGQVGVRVGGGPKACRQGVV